MRVNYALRLQTHLTSRLPLVTERRVFNKRNGGSQSFGGRTEAWHLVWLGNVGATWRQRSRLITVVMHRDVPSRRLGKCGQSEVDEPTSNGGKLGVDDTVLFHRAEHSADVITVLTVNGANVTVCFSDCGRNDVFL